jgi:murein DD-endopeptidase MepM/ murein hydrolase activator NlpD
LKESKEQLLDSGEAIGRSRTPVSRSFQDRFKSCNGLEGPGFNEWLLHPAMLFWSDCKWWGDLGKRKRPHEGLDLCVYQTRNGEIRHVDARTVVPVVYEGQVARVVDDFLGKSVFVSHGCFGNDGSRLYTVYGHLSPRSGLLPGDGLGERDIIGTVAGAPRKGKTIPPHLHISVAWIPGKVSPAELDWKLVGDLAGVVLVDPLSVIELPYSIATAV